MHIGDKQRVPHSSCSLITCPACVAPFRSAVGLFPLGVGLGVVRKGVVRLKHAVRVVGMNVHPKGRGAGGRKIIYTVFLRTTSKTSERAICIDLLPYVIILL